MSKNSTSKKCEDTDKYLVLIMELRYDNYSDDYWNFCYFPETLRQDLEFKKIWRNEKNAK